jgi:thioredoxin-like negative regulator of GroEL
LEEIDDLNIFKVDVVEQAHIGHIMAIRAVPTLIYLREGKDVSFKVGLIDTQQFRKWVADI